MRRISAWIAALMIIALPSACQNLDQTVQNLKSPDANTRRQAINDMARFGASAVPKLIAAIEAPDADPSAVMTAKMALERVVFHATRPGAAPEHKAVENVLLARLQKPASEDLQHFLLHLITVAGTSQSVPTLQKLLQDKNLREPARMALQQIPGDEATVTLERAFAQAKETQWKCALLMAIGERKQPRSAKVVLGALKDAQAQVRLTAITVAGDFPSKEVENALKTIAQKGNAAEKEAAQHSLMRLAERLRRAGAVRGAAPVYQWLFANGTSPQLRAAALTGVVRCGGADANAALIKALAHPNPALQEAAHVLLREVSNPGTAQSLMVQLQQARGAQRLRLIELLGYQSSATNVVLPALLNAMGDKDPAVKASAIAAMGRLRHPDAASAVMIALKDNSEEVRQAAVQAAPGIAFALHKQGKKDLAIVLARNAVEKAHNRDDIIELVGVLKSLGAIQNLREYTMQQGRITNWWVAAPVSNRATMRQREFLNPEAPIDLTQSVNGVQWRRVELDDPLAVLELMWFAAQSEVGAYAYAEVYSPTEQTVILRIGSDDDVVCWVNGKKVHEFIGDRGLTIDQDTATATLQQGWNRILCKVLNGVGNWQLTLRIASPNGAPLRLQQR